MVIGAEIGQGHHRRCSVHGIALAVVDAAAVARNIGKADIGIDRQVVVIGQVTAADIHTPSPCNGVYGCSVVIAIHGHGDHCTACIRWDSSEHPGEGHGRSACLCAVQYVIRSDRINAKHCRGGAWWS